MSTVAVVVRARAYTVDRVPVSSGAIDIDTRIKEATRI